MIGRSEQDDVVLGVQEVELPEVLDHLLLDAALEGEVEFLERLVGGEAVAEQPAASAWLTAFTIAIRQTARYDDNFQTIVTALENDILPIERDVRALAKLSDRDLQERLPGLERMSFIDQARIKNLLTKYRDAQ